MSDYITKSFPVTSGAKGERVDYTAGSHTVLGYITLWHTFGVVLGDMMIYIVKII